MKQPDRFNQDSTTPYNQDTASDPKWIGKYRAAIVGGSLMLIGLLGIYGCTKKSEPSMAVVSPNPPAAPPSAVSSLPAATAAQTVVHKRKVQRTSPTATYTNDAYGITFRYPRNYQLKELSVTAGEAKPAAMEESTGGDPAEVPLATVQMPESLYPKTNFNDGYFSVSANRSLTEVACQQSVITHEDSEVLTEKINGVEFHWTENSGAEDENYSEWHSYAGFANGTCYEVQVGLETSLEPKVADRKSPKEVDSVRVFSRLKAILSSLKIRPVVVPAAEPPARSFAETPSTIPGAPVPNITAVNSEVVCPHCTASVAQAYVVAGSTLNIVGHGFLPGNTVWIGSLNMPAVSEKDSGQIHISVPESLPVGIYALYVVNASGKSDAVTVVVRPPTVEHAGAIIEQSTEPEIEMKMSAAK